ncbi:hypothetical protein WH297_12950 [Ochrobactrum vermis]|uniref:Uncharacterized protein n=1 Tax=Ochrobactrum vermis TaxID=1827297 RepID=A0ABU8PEF4_9HYPH|nr:hypothetical protein [Ochrobactrum vermis]PQZ30936.1 hypothetical protein CQZ93_13155 [Ochrobactrum vermis]
MNKPISLIDREIEAKIDAAVRAELVKGKKVSDLSAKDIRNIAADIRTSFSPSARKELVIAGVEHAIKLVLGAKIAEVIWHDGTGWPSDDMGVLSAASRVTVKGKPLKQPQDEALESFNVFRDALPDLNRDAFMELCEPAMIDRFQCLFAGQPEDRTLGEIATLKAMSRDKVAMSFLAWRPIA